MDIQGFCLGTFDEKIGPVSLYSQGITPELAKKVVLKVMVGTLSCFNDIDNNSICHESIIPFPDDGLVAFTIFFQIKSPEFRSESKKFSLTVVFDNQRRNELYQSASQISKMLQNISKMFRIHYKYDEEYPYIFLEKLYQILYDFTTNNMDNRNIKKIQITCPVCSNKNDIVIFNEHQTDLFAHSVTTGEICNHQFTVYLNSNLNFVAYKSEDIKLKDLSPRLELLKTPYDKIYEEI